MLQASALVCYHFGVPPWRFSVRCWGVLGASLIAWTVGCQAKPDVVATTKTDASATTTLNVPNEKQLCRPGHYEGHMNTVPDGGIVNVPFSADINFSLVKGLAGEISVFQDTQMLSGNNENGSHFTAEIVGGIGCTEGTFSTELLNGMYWTTSDPNSAPILFVGSIEGTYTAEFDGFTGNWSTTLHFPTFDLPVSGRWSANYAGPAATSSN